MVNITRDRWKGHGKRYRWKGHGKHHGSQMEGKYSRVTDGHGKHHGLTDGRDIVEHHGDSRDMVNITGHRLEGTW